MVMQVSLSPELETFVARKVATGVYGNANDVIRDAVHRMQADEQRADAWQAAIRVGIDQLEHGNGVAYTDEEAANIKQAAIKAMHSGQPISPDVLP